MTCADGAHAWVVASGTCAACELPVQASGALDATATPGWLAPPFADPTASASCTAGGPHAPEHATGTCTTCSAPVGATTAGPGLTAWFS